MSVLKASDITQRTAVFSEECKKLDNMRDELLNVIFAPLLRGIVEHAKEIEKIKEEEEDAESIGKEECCVQNEEQEG
jgi:hypothetical protein